MTTIAFKGNPIHTSGELPEVGSVAPDFLLVQGDLSEASLKDFPGKKLLNIFPSLDTDVCSASVRAFFKRMPSVLNISRDLPFAQKRFCTAEGIGSAVTLSAFRSSFPQDYGLEIVDGPLKGLCSRAVLVLDEQNRVLYRQQVPEITQQPDYEAALASFESAT